MASLELPEDLDLDDEVSVTITIARVPWRRVAYFVTEITQGVADQAAPEVKVSVDRVERA